MHVLGICSVAGLHYDDEGKLWFQRWVVQTAKLRYVPCQVKIVAIFYSVAIKKVTHVKRLKKKVVHIHYRIVRVVFCVVTHARIGRNCRLQHRASSPSLEQSKLECDVYVLLVIKVIVKLPHKVQ